MTAQNIALYNFSNGTFMIMVFALVCVALIISLLLFIGGGSKKQNKE